MRLLCFCLCGTTRWSVFISEYIRDNKHSDWKKSTMNCNWNQLQYSAKATNPVKKKNPKNHRDALYKGIWQLIVFSRATQTCLWHHWRKSIMNTRAFGSRLTTSLPMMQVLEYLNIVDISKTPLVRSPSPSSPCISPTSPKYSSKDLCSLDSCSQHCKRPYYILKTN